jgi:hypothetical protein
MRCSCGTKQQGTKCTFSNYNASVPIKIREFGPNTGTAQLLSSVAYSNSPLQITLSAPIAFPGLQPGPGQPVTTSEFYVGFPVTTTVHCPTRQPLRPRGDAFKPLTSSTLQRGHLVATGSHTPQLCEAQSWRIKSCDVCIGDPDNTATALSLRFCT